MSGLRLWKLIGLIIRLIASMFAFASFFIVRKLHENKRRRTMHSYRLSKVASR